MEMIHPSSEESIIIPNVQSQTTVESDNSHQINNQFSRFDFIVNY